jgi:hypothetical protein
MVQKTIKAYKIKELKLKFIMPDIAIEQVLF